MSRPKVRPSGASATWREIGDRRRGYTRPAGTAATSRYRGGNGRRLDDLDKTIAPFCRDVAILAETLALFVRYFLTITPVLPESEQESARRLGRERFEVFVPQVGQRLLGTFASYRKSSRPSPYQPNLFATASGDGLPNGCNSHKQWSSGCPGRKPWLLRERGISNATGGRSKDGGTPSPNVQSLCRSRTNEAW